ncbi:hypothetical protein [Streptomyces sp. NPDC088915]|uniref:hypothetical protein n=1 Tax=Streptomyces sp. NPDC088915 TaxID=3365912 RepID=UPI00380342C9
MTRRPDPREMRGGWQMDLFPVEEEPVSTAPADQSPIGDRPPAAAVPAEDQEVTA